MSRDVDALYARFGLPPPDAADLAVANDALEPLLAANLDGFAFRKELVKLVRRYAEEGKVAVRNVRRDVMRHLEELVKNGDVGDDEERRAETHVQKLTDEHVARIDELLKHKEAEIMEV